MSTRHRKRVERLEQCQRGGERLRVVERWPGEEPRPATQPGELLVILRRFGPRSPACPATVEEGAPA